MSEYQVTCINKPHRDSSHEHITHIGNVTNTLPNRWRMTRETAIAQIDRTHADGKYNDNLLAQPGCDGTYPLVG